MKKEDLLNEEFLKQFKSGDELNSFIQQLKKRAIEQLLEGELDAHLRYDRHNRSKSNNARNSHSKKSIKTSDGELQISVPRDREASFNPILEPKRKSFIGGIENVIISLYAKGMTVSDNEEQLLDVYGFEVSTSTISRITDRVVQNIITWQNRPLDPVYTIVWMDGIVFKVKDGSKVIDKTDYISVGLGIEGKKELLGM